MQHAPHDTDTTPPTDGAMPKRRPPRDRHARRIVVGLTGLLGVVWATVIASRHFGIPGV